jgi:arsenate reductase-like glutaredoxin family protein
MKNMAKGNKKSRKKVEVKEKTIYEEFPVRTLSQADADRMKEIFTLSNNVSALIRDYAEKTITVKHLKTLAKEIKDSKQPLIVQVAKNVYKTETKYDRLSDDILKQAEELEKSLVLIHGQIEHRYEDYVSSLVRHQNFIEMVIKSAENKVITGHRDGAVIGKQEEELFEKEYEQVLTKKE